MFWIFFAQSLVCNMASRPVMCPQFSLKRKSCESSKSSKVIFGIFVRFLCWIYPSQILNMALYHQYWFQNKKIWCQEKICIANTEIALWCTSHPPPVSLWSWQKNHFLNKSKLIKLNWDNPHNICSSLLNF